MNANLIDLLKRLLCLDAPEAKSSLKTELAGTIHVDANEAISPLNGSTLDSSCKKSFDKLAGKIAKGEIIRSPDLLPYLTFESLASRIYVNYQLGCVFHHAGKFSEAAVFIERAWNLSLFDADVFTAFKTIMIANGRTSVIREGHKRLGLKLADAGELSSAIAHFDQAHFAYSFFDKEDRWEFDYDIMRSLDQAARCSRVEQVVSRFGKLRVGYLLRGLVETNSILIRHALAMVQSCDHSEFEVECFSLDSKQSICDSPQGLTHLKSFAATNCPVTTCGDNADRVQQIIDLTAIIRKHKIDVLVLTASLVDYSTYFLAALKPAPILVGLIQGPPAQFAPPILDWSIAWSKHPQLDSPVDCSIINWSGSGSIPDVQPRYSRRDFNIPEQACVIISGGRIEKFQNRRQWQSVANVLASNVLVHYVVCGVKSSAISGIEELLSDELSTRVHFLGWRTDFAQLLSLADIMLDTYPNGGGQCIAEAMEYGLPIVGHRNNFMQLFNQTDWSPIEDLISIDRLVVERGDFQALELILSELANSQELRKSLGAKCKSLRTSYSTAEAVKVCEQLFLRLRKTKLANS